MFLRTVDVRTGKWTHHLNSAPAAQSGGYVKAMATSSDNQKLAVALSNGSNSVIDIRTGKILAHFVLQYSDIIQVNF